MAFLDFKPKIPALESTTARIYIYLWNPATRFCTKVLELDRLDECGYYTHGGLCFDFSKNVYKAMFIMDHQTPDYGGEFVIVASLKDKRWRTVKFPYDIRSVSEAITLHGRLHYGVRVKKKDESMWDSFDPCNEIIYFDPVSEKFHMFPVPEPKTDQGENAIVGLGVLNECLSMTCLKDDKVGVEILVMKEYGVKESWTSLFFIRNLKINPSYGMVTPFSMTEDGELILEIYDLEEKFVVYNPKNDNTQNLHIRGEKVSIYDTINYVESLISPKEYYRSRKRHKKFGQLDYYIEDGQKKKQMNAW
ncbi:PREDICTED: F-box/kelch-repeat protein At3g06240-like [Nicotiana attenuata]|uniref:F-box/kelch-repeat protein At3g06240-like n=1 Tax=Nicotiana attenuata TaxID=49451 RepID=UPI0009053A3D|nr:PREDICTED: F-box/kelch-repeat protein At3g06240-like [Nicotiana attenuata]